VIADLLEVLVVQFAVQRGEQRPQPVGVELPGMPVGDRPELPEARQVRLEMRDRAGEVGEGSLVAASIAALQAPPVLKGADGDVVHLPDDLGVGEALDQLLVAGRQARREVEVLILVQEMDLHGATLSRSRS
jgi:hypothetical protein